MKFQYIYKSVQLKLTYRNYKTNTNQCNADSQKEDNNYLCINTNKEKNNNNYLCVNVNKQEDINNGQKTGII